MVAQRSAIFACSDSVGETAEAVIRATVSQFDAERVDIRRWPNVRTEDEIRQVMEQAAASGGFVVYTLVTPELREMLRQEAARLNVSAVDIMGPVMEAFVHTLGGSPKRQPGLLHRMDNDYFRRVEAVEFAVKCDDGQEIASWNRADLILLGVSRTSKTPLSVFLAHKGCKAANYPLVPEVKPPDELFEQPAGKLVGLTIRPDSLVSIRRMRLQAMGLPAGVAYASPARVEEELAFAEALYRRLGCPVIDVSDKGIEESAWMILETIG